MADSIEMRVARLEANMNYLKQEFEETLKAAYDRACENGDAEEAAEFARKLRNHMLDMTDKYSTVDRLFNFDLPENINMTTIIQAVRALIEGIKNIGRNDWAVYRQHLRDITAQEGFPFRIDWGNAPEKVDEK